jgi:hypothetical protein
MVRFSFRANTLLPASRLRRGALKHNRSRSSFCSGYCYNLLATRLVDMTVTLLGNTAAASRALHCSELELELACAVEKIDAAQEYCVRRPADTI